MELDAENIRDLSSGRLIRSPCGLGRMHTLWCLMECVQAGRGALLGEKAALFSETAMRVYRLSLE